MSAGRNNKVNCQKYFASPRGKAAYKARTHGYRARALIILGRVCCRCGFGADGPDDHLSLQVDHKIPVRRKTSGNTDRAIQVYNRIIRGDVEPFQLLCANCHAIKTAKEDPFAVAPPDLPLFFGAVAGNG